MKTSTEESLLSELRQLCGRLGEAIAHMDGNPAGSVYVISRIRADHIELHTRIDEEAAGRPERKVSFLQ